MVKYPLALLPEVDVRDGRAQLPPSGGMLTDTAYGDAADAVSKWIAQGATWLHLDDPTLNRTTIDHVRGVHLQLAGGIDDQAKLDHALATRAARIVIEPTDVAWAAKAVAEHGERLVCHLDIRLPELDAVLAELDSANCRRYLVEETATHHHWHHNDKHLLDDFCQRTRAKVEARGGIKHLEDLHQLHELATHGLDGIVIGQALYDGSFTLAEAMAASADRFDLFFWGPPQP